jgi:hypothetical protein
MACLVALVATTAANAGPIGFSGPYAPSNWTLTTLNSDGTVNTAGAPNSISITSGDNGSGGSGDTNYTITMPASGTVSFDWDYTTVDTDAFFDPFGYTVNGVFTPLIDSFGVTSGSGSVILFLNAGDTFGFQANTFDNILGRSTTVISNFDAPVPEPISLVVFGGLIVGGGLVARKRLLAKKAVA